MKVTEIRYEKLVNLGHFSHAKGSVMIALDEGDSPIEAFAKARHLVATQISEEAHRQEDLKYHLEERGDCPGCGGEKTQIDVDTGNRITCISCGGSGFDIPF
jgi:hypothetical protein